jgi:hypothetical protein
MDTPDTTDPNEEVSNPDITYEDGKRKIAIDIDLPEWVLIIGSVLVALCMGWVTL